MTPAAPLLSQLHDATLQCLHFDWGTGDVLLELSAVLDGRTPSRVVLRASAATLLRCPRQSPWGRSASINAVRSASAQDGRVRLEVEVQCGDVIEVEAREVTVEVVA